jgi:hypothetical protein
MNPNTTPNPVDRVVGIIANHAVGNDRARDAATAIAKEFILIHQAELPEVGQGREAKHLYVVAGQKYYTPDADEAYKGALGFLAIREHFIKQEAAAADAKLQERRDALLLEFGYSRSPYASFDPESRVRKAVDRIIALEDQLAATK